MTNHLRAFAALILAVLCSFVGVPSLLAAEVTPTVDTPLSFRASFKGLDTDAHSIDGNDFQVFTFDFWTVVVNLRGDGVDADGAAFGFYEVNLSRTGSKAVDSTAPVVKTYLFYANLQPGVTLSDNSVSSQPHGDGSEYLTTSVNILYDPSANAVRFAGTIAGDSDLNGDGIIDSDQTSTDTIVKTLQTLKDIGLITGKEMGQILKQTNQPIK
jgi:hypothetical protein